MVITGIIIFSAAIADGKESDGPPAFPQSKFLTHLSFSFPSLVHGLFAEPWVSSGINSSAKVRPQSPFFPGPQGCIVGRNMQFV